MFALSFFFLCIFGLTACAMILITATVSDLIAGILGPHRMNFTDFDHPLTFYLVPPAGQKVTYPVTSTRYTEEICALSRVVHR